MFKFDNTYTRLPEKFFARVAPAGASNPELIKWNPDLARVLGAHPESISQKELAEIFSGQRLLPGSEPIALAYAGHQFGHFVPQLGDGRALLLGEVLDPAGKRHDIQLKGSGRTPFSRGGDGKAPLGPVIREYLVSEGMYHLGLPTTRALAAVSTGELVHRDRIFPGAVLARVASSHIRVGTFEYFAARNDHENLKILAEYSIKRHFPEIEKEPESMLQLFQRVGQAQVELVTGWMAKGFIHGVMNTDNMSIAGETIDYGPCAFMDHFQWHKVFSSIDQSGRYSYANQARITLWNLSRLGDCLLPFIDDGSRNAALMLNRELDYFETRFDEKLMQKMRRKLGILDEHPEDRQLIRNWLQHLETEKLDYTLSFRLLADMLKEEPAPDLFKETPAFHDFYQSWQRRIQSQGLEKKQIREHMDRVNPVYIPRNHKIEQTVNAGLEGDLSLFHEMNEVLARPYEEREGYSSYKLPPEPEETVRATFCGT